MDEAGSVSIIGAAAVILVSAVATLVVDAGFAYLSKRELQGAVDIAALNAVQAPTRIEATARDAIQKNYGDPDGLTAFEVTPGEFPTGAQLDEMLKLPVDQRRLLYPASGRFQPDGTDFNAVKIRASSQSESFFGRLFSLAAPTVQAQAIAVREPFAQLTIGTGLVSLGAPFGPTALNPTTPSVLNGLLQSFLGVNPALGLAHYEGLLVSNISVGSLIEAAARVAGIPESNARAVLDALVPAADLYEALADAVANNAARTALSRLANATPEGVRVRLDDLFPIDLLKPERAADGTVNLFHLAWGMSDRIADGAHAASVNLDLADLGPLGALLRSATLEIGLLQPSQHSAIGGPGTEVQSSQVRVKLNLDLVDLNLGLLSVALRLPVLIEAASAVARIDTVACGSKAVEDAVVGVSATSAAVKLTVGEAPPGFFTNSGPVAALPAALVNAPAVRVFGNASVAVGAQSGEVAFQHPFDIERVWKIGAPGDPSVMGAALLSDLDLDVTVLGLPLLGTGIVEALVKNALTALTPLLDTILEVPFRLAGLQLGGADVSVPHVRCGNAILAG